MPVVPPSHTHCFHSKGRRLALAAAVDPRRSRACISAPLGTIIQDSVYASGSWITGDFTVFAEANTLPYGKFDASLKAVGSDTSTDSGKITLPAGMTSATVTFGVTDLTGTAGVLDLGAVVDTIEL